MANRFEIHFFLRMFQTFYRRFYQNTTNHVMGSRADHDKSRYEAYSVEKLVIIIIIIIKSLFQAMPIKVRCTIAQKSAQIVGARVHV